MLSIITLFIIVPVFSFVTLAAPMISVLATVSTRGISITEAPQYLKIIRGVAIGATASMLAASAGLPDCTAWSRSAVV